MRLVRRDPNNLIPGCLKPVVRIVVLTGDKRFVESTDRLKCLAAKKPSAGNERFSLVHAALKVAHGRPKAHVWIRAVRHAYRICAMFAGCLRLCNNAFVEHEVCVNAVEKRAACCARASITLRAPLWTSLDRDVRYTLG